MAILYGARSESLARAARDAEAPVLPGRASANAPADAPDNVAAHREVGRCLGFPGCCVAAFCARVARGVDRLELGPGGLAEDYVAAREAWVERPDARINNLLFAARLKLVSFYPCRYDCAVAIRFAQAVHDVVARSERVAAGQLLEALSRPIAIAPSNARAIVTLDGERRILTADPPRDSTGRSLHLDAAFAASLAGAAVEEGGRIAGSGEPGAWLIRFGRSG
jgi:hypothetical protein